EITIKSSLSTSAILFVIVCLKNLFINNFCFKNYSLSSFNLNYHFLKTSRDKSFTLLSSSKTTYFSFANTTMYQYINILILYYIFYLTIIFEINIFYYKGHT